MRVGRWYVKTSRGRCTLKKHLAFQVTAKRDEEPLAHEGVHSLLSQYERFNCMCGTTLEYRSRTDKWGVDADSPNGEEGIRAGLTSLEELLQTKTSSTMLLSVARSPHHHCHQHSCNLALYRCSLHLPMCLQRHLRSICPLPALSAPYPEPNQLRVQEHRAPDH